MEEKARNNMSGEGKVRVWPYMIVQCCFVQPYMVVQIGFVQQWGENQEWDEWRRKG